MLASTIVAACGFLLAFLGDYASYASREQKVLKEEVQP